MPFVVRSGPGGPPEGRLAQASGIEVEREVNKEGILKDCMALIYVCLHARPREFSQNFECPSSALRACTGQTP